MKTRMVSSGTSHHTTPNGYNRYARAAKRSERRQSILQAWSFIVPHQPAPSVGTFGRA